MWLVMVALMAAFVSPSLMRAQTVQVPGRVLSAGYSAPRPLKAAPGQVITLFVHAPNGTKPQGRLTAPRLPLPAELGGYAVTLEQTLYPNPIQVPVFAVEGVDNCYGLTPSVCIELTAVTIQIPWELVPNLAQSGRPENFGTLTVSYQGVKGEAVPLQPEVDSIHVITTCDSPEPPGIDRPRESTGPCRPLVTHLDGQLVTPANPAAGGERLLLYAFGLGRAEGDLRTGDAVQSSSPFTDVAVGFQFGLNLDPNRPAGVSPEAATATADLITGQVGLYRVAITMPAVPVNTRECTASTIESNLTVSIGRQQSYSGAGICAQP